MFDPIHLPDHVWADNTDVLRDRDVGALFRLAKRYAGASQHRIATATGMPQSRVNQLMNGRCGPVTSIDVLRRIADGLNLPDSVRAALGLASGHGGRVGGARPSTRAGSPGARASLEGVRVTADLPEASPERGDSLSRCAVPSKDTVLAPVLARFREYREDSAVVDAAVGNGADAVGWGFVEESEMAAEESARFVRSAARAVSGHVLEQLDGDVARLAREYLRRPPYALIRPLAAARGEVFAMIDARPHPRFLPDLYRAAGRFTALLAHASSDLGQAYAADSHARSALLCAQYAGDADLAAYVRWLQSNTAYWQGDYQAAAELAAAGLGEAASGNEVLRLSSQQARAWAAAGQVEACETALSRAGEARDRMIGEPSPDGVFAFPTGKAAYYASEVRLALGGTQNARRAVAEATEALALLEADPQTSNAAELHAATRLDLAAAYLQLGDLDAVTAHTRLVLDLPAESRTVPIVGRMTGTYQALGDPGTADSHQVLDLREQIEVFTAYPAARGAPELPA